MARFQNMTANKLKATKVSASEITFAGTAKWTIPYIQTIAGENAATALSESFRAPVSTADHALFSYSVNGTPSYMNNFAFAALDLVDGDTVGNMATTDRINVMCIRKGLLHGWGVVAAGTHESVAADNVTHAVTVAGVLSTDIAFCQSRTQESNARFVRSVACTTNTVTVTFNGATAAATHKFDYVVLRPMGTFTPSHDLVLAGTASLVSLGAGTTDTIAITGLRPTDVVICCPKTMTETDHYMVAANPATAGTLSLTFQGAPGETVMTYAIFRAAQNP